MLKGLTNLFMTAALVVGATMATTAALTIVMLLTQWDPDLTQDPGMLASGLSAALMGGAVGGAVFSAVTLVVAALTMPPTIGLARLLKLPRPLVDCIGGGAAGLLCSALAISAFESLARAKGGDVPDGAMRLVFDLFAMAGGGLTGYVRYRVIGRMQATAAQVVLA